MSVKFYRNIIIAFAAKFVCPKFVHEIANKMRIFRYLLPRNISVLHISCASLREATETVSQLFNRLYAA